MRFTGSVSYRPVRIGFLIPPEDLSLVSRVARLSACLWGGRYNPIIPFFETGGDRWRLPSSASHGLSIARGYINFFEPDVLVEAEPGMAEKLGWEAGELRYGLPRVLSLEEFYKSDRRDFINFAPGIDIFEVMSQLYDIEFKYELRHRKSFVSIEDSQGDAFFDVVCGRYPADESLQYIVHAYNDVFSPEILKSDSTTAIRHLTERLSGPLSITGHELAESLGSGLRDDAIYVFDPTNPGDVIDYWNFRLVERRALPINVNWFKNYATFLNEHIGVVHRAIPGNPFGTMFHSTLYFASSISEERQSELIQRHLCKLPERAFYLARDPLVWQRPRRGSIHGEVKIRATGEAVSFDEEIGSEKTVKIPAPSPSFLNQSERYTNACWVNVIVPDSAHHGETPAIVYPTNLWSPSFPRLAFGERLRIGREGWILPIKRTIGYSLLKIQTRRDAIIDWLKTQGFDATPSDEGQVAAQVIGAAGGLMASGMFADEDTLKLLGDMAESHSEVNRDNRRTVKTTPDRSKHINTINEHFAARGKRSFGYWNQLEYFLERSVFRAGLRVQCPICSYQNWLDLDAISYRPTCTRCLNDFEFSQSHSHLHKVEWYYRVVGPFAAPDYAKGGYAVALTLRALADPHSTELTWSTGLFLKQLNCEIDFVAWHRGNLFQQDELDEPLLVVGEAKSFGHNKIDDKCIADLRKVADRFPGAVMVVSTLRAPEKLSLAEIGRIRHLAIWGRRANHNGRPINPLIVLTGTELFAEHGISQAWERADDKEIHPAIDLEDLHTLADLTQERYLGLRQHWGRRATERAHESMRSLLQLLAAPKLIQRLLATRSN